MSKYIINEDDNKTNNNPSLLELAAATTTTMSNNNLNITSSPSNNNPSMLSLASSLNSRPRRGSSRRGSLDPPIRLVSTFRVVDHQEERKINWNARKRWFHIRHQLIKRNCMLIEDEFLTDAQRMNRLLLWMDTKHPLAKETKVVPVHHRSKLSRIRSNTWQLFDNPSSSTLASCIAIFVFITIAISVLAIVLETVPSLEDQQSTWYIVETTTVIIFTIEFIIRVVSCPLYMEFVKDPLNWVDFIAILPFYIEVIFADASSYGSAALRSLRLVRIFRVLKVSRYVIWVRMFSGVLRRSSQPLIMLGFVMLIAIIFFSSALYFFERGSWNEQSHQYFDKNGNISQFQSIPDAFWWCIITLTTVGYGDIVPLTGFGRLIAGVACLFGILALAIPISVISQRFTHEYIIYQRRQRAAQKQLRSIHRTYIDFIFDVRKKELIKKSDIEAMIEEHSLMKHTSDPLKTHVQDILDEAYTTVDERLSSVIETEKVHFRTLIWDLMEDHLDGEVCS